MKKNIPDDVKLLNVLKDQGVASGVPSQDYDDSYLIQYAKQKKAYIISNDRFKDHIENYGKKDHFKIQELRNWLKQYLISYTFVNDDFMPNPDFL